jgi:hypothetical protein
MERMPTTRRFCVAKALGVSGVIPALFLLSAVHAQVTWVQRTPSAPVTNQRGVTALAYHAGSDRILFFGGLGGLPSFPPWGDTWELDGDRWTQRSPLTNPPKRGGHALAADTARGRVVLFGGGYLTPPGTWTYYTDTWEWDGANWIQPLPATNPSGRTWTQMAYDAGRGRVVLFGGADGQNGQSALGDTWEWDGTNWLRRSPTRSPSARHGHAMAYDPARGVVVLFGGGQLSDTWEWDGANWTQRFPATSPSARSQHGLVYDVARGRLVLFGGTLGGPVYFLDTWEWIGNDWVQRLAAGGVRGGPAVYDSGRDRVVQFSGESTFWTFGPTNPGSHVSFGNGCSGSAGTPALRSGSNQRPWVGENFTLSVT